MADRTVPISKPVFIATLPPVARSEARAPSFPFTLALCGLCMAGVLLRELPVLAGPGQNRDDSQRLNSPRDSSAGLKLRIASSIDRAAGDDPPVPDSVRDRYRGQVLKGKYSVCVLADGTVRSVRVSEGIPDVDAGVISTIKTWRYAPQPQGTLTCTTEVLSFEL